MLLSLAILGGFGESNSATWLEVELGIDFVHGKVGTFARATGSTTATYYRRKTRTEGYHGDGIRAPGHFRFRIAATIVPNSLAGSPKIDVPADGRPIYISRLVSVSSRQTKDELR